MNIAEWNEAAHGYEEAQRQMMQGWREGNEDKRLKGEEAMNKFAAAEASALGP